MADPSIIECATACTITVVHEISLPILNLTADQGAEISRAILLVWAAAWGIRTLVQLVKNSDGNSTNEEN